MEDVARSVMCLERGQPAVAAVHGETVGQRLVPRSLRWMARNLEQAVKERDTQKRPGTTKGRVPCVRVHRHFSFWGCKETCSRTNGSDRLFVGFVLAGYVAGPRRVWQQQGRAAQRCLRVCEGFWWTSTV